MQMKKKYSVPQAQLISIRQAGNLLVTSGDIYNGGANVSELLEITEFEQNGNNMLEEYFDADSDITLW